MFSPIAGPAECSSPLAIFLDANVKLAPFALIAYRRQLFSEQPHYLLFGTILQEFYFLRHCKNDMLGVELIH